MGRRKMAALLALSLLITAAPGCSRTPEAAVSQSGVSDISSETSRPEQHGNESTAPKEESPLVLWEQVYTGPSPMPPEEEMSTDGHMLWPVWNTLEVDAYDGAKRKYGFINEQGVKVIPNNYVLYHYDYDQKGQCYLFAGQGSYTDIFTMAGEKILRLPGESAQILDGTDWILVKKDILDIYMEKYYTDTCQYLYDLKTGENLLKEEYAYIQMLRPNLFLAMDPQRREYLLSWDNGTFRRTLLEGYTTAGIGSAAAGAEEFLLPAASAPLDPFEKVEGVRFGYLKMDGTWAIAPQYRDITAFIGEYAGVETETGEWRFIDRQGRFAGEKTYDRIYVFFLDEDTYGFSIYDDTGKEYHIDEALNETEVTQNSGWINGKFYYRGQELEGMPSGCEWLNYVEWPIVIAGSPTALYWLNLETGMKETLYGEHRMIGEFCGMFVFKKQEDTVVLDVTGQKLADTVFHRYPSAIDYLEESQYDSRLSTAGRYLWVTTAKYQGYMDATGKWMYRESRYSVLED